MLEFLQNIPWSLTVPIMVIGIVWVLRKPISKLLVERTISIKGESEKTKYSSVTRIQRPFRNQMTG